MYLVYAGLWFAVIFSVDWWDTLCFWMALKFISFCFIALKQITKTDKDSLLLAKQLLNHNIQKQGKKRRLKSTHPEMSAGKKARLLCHIEEINRRNAANMFLLSV